MISKNSNQRLEHYAAIALACCGFTLGQYYSDPLRPKDTVVAKAESPASVPLNLRGTPEG